MPYKVYITHCIESLEGAEIIAEVESYDAAWRAIDKYLEDHKFRKEKYCRFLLAKDAVYIDFGSWSTFAAISPPPADLFN